MFNPHDNLSLAQRLLLGSPDEAACRAAVGRAYYACFLTARDQLFGDDAIGLTKRRIRQVAGKRRVGTHEIVLLAIPHSPGPSAGRLKTSADQLGELKDMRVQADYFRNPDHPRTIPVFKKYQVTAWDGLAHQAMQLASNLLAPLAHLNAVP